MNPDQTNTRAAGPFPVLAGEDLTGKRSMLVVLTHAGSVPEVKLPATNNALALYQLMEEGIDAALVEVEPIASGGRARRFVLKDTCEPGDILVLADTAGADKGKVRKLPAVAGVYVQIAIAEEKGVDTQHVLARPFLKIVTVASVVAAPAALTSTNGAAAAAIPAAGTYAAPNAGAVNSGDAGTDTVITSLRTQLIALAADVAAIHAADLLAQAENEKIGDDARALHAKVAALVTALTANGQIAAA